MPQEEIKDRSCKTPRWRMLKARLQNIDPQTFSKKIKEEKDAVLIDVRTPKEFEHYHFERAINVNYFAEDMWEQIESMDKNKPYLLYCRSGRRSIRVGTLMRNGGFDSNKVFNLDGGLVAWKEFFGEGK